MSSIKWTEQDVVTKVNAKRLELEQRTQVIPTAPALNPADLLSKVIKTPANTTKVANA